MAVKMKTNVQTKQTIATAYQRICAGEDPWIGLGDFMHEFFRSALSRRSALVKKPITVPETPTLQQRQWAVFCAAAVEYLCQKYTLPCPAWAQTTETLEEPWFDFGSSWSQKEHVRMMLREDTPEVFARRNIYCGDRVFLNPHEHMLPGEKRSA